MIFYFILVLIPISNILVKNKKLYCIFITLILILFVGLRSNYCGQDTHMYEWVYNSFAGKDWEQCLSLRNYTYHQYEFGYFVFQYIITRVFDFNIFKVICAFMSIAPAGFLIYRYSKHPWMSFMIYFMLPFFATLSMSAIRQGLAFGCCLMAFHFCVERKLKMVFLFAFIAFFFHHSSVFFIFIYLFNYIGYKRRYNKWIYLILGIIASTSTVIFLFLVRFNRLGYEVGEAGGVRTLIFMFILYFCSYLVSENKLRMNLNKYFIYLLAITIALWFIGMNLAAIFRLAAYTEFFICLYVSNILSLIKASDIRRCVISGTFVVCFLLMDSLVIHSKHEYPVNPFYFMWEDVNHIREHNIILQ